MNNLILLAEIGLPHDFQSTLIWVILSLVAAVGVVWRLYVSAINKINENSQRQIQEINKIMEKRVEEKQDLIKELLEKVDKVQEEKEKLISEIKPALEVMNKTFLDVLNFMRDATNKS